MIYYDKFYLKGYRLTPETFREILRCGRVLLREYRDELTDEVDATLLAEGIAHELAGYEWLDDPAHPLWDIAAELANA